VDTFRTEEEQVEAIKSWWKENGTNTLVTVVVAVAIVIGWRGWQDSQVEGTAAASALYQSLFQVEQQISVEPNDEDQATANHLTEQLKESHENSAYARYAALLKSKRSAESGDLDTAEAELLWALDHTDGTILSDDDLPLRDLLQLRLAKVFMAQEKFDQAQTALNEIVAKQFVAMAQEVEGDILFAQGETAKAKEQYQIAIDNQDRVGSTEVLRIKMSNL